jgi:hypothetical protein
LVEVVVEVVVEEADPADLVDPEVQEAQEAETFHPAAQLSTTSKLHVGQAVPSLTFLLP